MPATPAPAGAPAPVALLVAAAVLAVQGVALVIYGGYLVVRPLTAGTTSLASLEVTGVAVLLTGLAFGLLARGVQAGRPWARSPVVVVELLIVPVAIPLVQAGLVLIGAAMLASAAAELLALAAPGARAALRRR